MNIMERDREKKYMDLCKKSYDEVIGYYQSVNEFCKPYTDINESMFTKSKKLTNSFIVQQVEGFTNYIMNTLIPRGVEWGKSKIDEDLLSLISIETTSEAVKNQTYENAKKTLEEANHKLFKLLNSSNYFDEFANSCWDCVTCGVGVAKIIDSKNPVSPFEFKRINLTDCYLGESSKGDIKRIYKKLKKYNFDMMVDEFGEDIESKWQNRSKSPDMRFDFIEFVYPNGKQYVRVVSDENMDLILIEETLEYNPYIVFRFRKHQSSPYGVGQGLWNYDRFVDLEKYETLDREQVESLIKPPLIAYGDPAIYQSLVLKAGKINYGGIQGTPQSLSVQQALPDYKYQVLESEIGQARMDISNAFMTNPLGDVRNSPDMTATESSIRAAQFRTQFAGLYERLVFELLNKLFMNCLIIMQKNEIIDLSKEFIDISKVTYSNAIADSYNNGELNKVLQAVNTQTQLLGFDARTIMINKGKVRDYTLDRIDCNIEVFNTNEEVTVALEQQEKQRQLMMQEQIRLDMIAQASKAGNEVMNNANSTGTI